MVLQGSTRMHWHCTAPQKKTGLVRVAGKAESEKKQKREKVLHLRTTKCILRTRLFGNPGQVLSQGGGDNERLIGLGPTHRAKDDEARRRSERWTMMIPFVTDCSIERERNEKRGAKIVLNFKYFNWVPLAVHNAFGNRWNVQQQPYRLTDGWVEFDDCIQKSHSEDERREKAFPYSTVHRVIK